MKHGFIRVAAATPDIWVADCVYNRGQIAEAMRTAAASHCELLVLPELCITGYTCGDLFKQQALQAEAVEALLFLAEVSQALNMLTVVGAPVMTAGRLYNSAVVIGRGEILGVVPKTYLPEYGEFCEKRLFTSPLDHDPGDTMLLGGREVPFGTRLLWRHTGKQDFTVAVEIGEDAWAPVPLSSWHTLEGATVVANLSAYSESAGHIEYRRSLMTQQSSRLLCGYIYANAGEGESTTDLVFSGHSLIAENGKVLSERPLFETGLIHADIDISMLASERGKNSSFGNKNVPGLGKYRVIPFTLDETDAPLNRRVEKHPFVPSGTEERWTRCEQVLQMQVMGLVQRLRHTGVRSLTLALSGGLDSTLALLVAVRAFKQLALDEKDICAITMPCFGTSERTLNNAKALAEASGVTLLTISILESVLQHFRDIGHSSDKHDLVYENAQARERTQVAMDVALQRGGFMLGTGDLSEMALGFTTYNGDHMSMYNVNASVPKTLIVPLLRTIAESASPDIQAVLTDIIDTPVSPELLPPEAGGQETEKLVGPYELHDFFIYYMMRFGFPPEKILYLACIAFSDAYDKPTILRWIKVFYRRFFANQYKRSCMPDGPKVGSVNFSPRSAWHMPSDASGAVWLARLESEEI